MARYQPQLSPGSVFYQGWNYGGLYITWGELSVSIPANLSGRCLTSEKTPGIVQFEIPQFEFLFGNVEKIFIYLVNI